ncbi:MAG: putative Ig domain-containing protein [Nanoarchaeota archaeon]|nr:putative Ig domain-containing protein [Nanoarchaeota archaeon]
MNKIKSVIGVLAILVSVIFIAGCTPDKTDPSGDFCIPDVNGVCQPVGANVKDTATSTDLKDTKPISEDTAPASVEGKTAENIPRLIYNVSQLIDLKSRLKVKDDDNNILTYSFTAPFDKEGTWQTTEADAGEYLVTITVSDGVSQVSKKVLVVLATRNRAPAIGKMADVIVSEGEKVSLNPNAVDPDGDALKMTYSGWMTSQEYQTKFGDAGDYLVTVTANDGNQKAVQVVKVSVRKANRAPVLDTFSDVNVQEGDKVTIVPKAYDSDGDKVTVSFSAPFNDQGVWQTKEGDQGAYRINVTAADGNKAVTQTFSLVVKGKNKPPVFASINDQTVNENQPLLPFTVSATDSENDVVTITAKDLPLGATFDSRTREFKWTPGYDSVTAIEGKKMFTATFEASDGTNKVSYSVTIYVNNQNRPPSLDIQ